MYMLCYRIYRQDVPWDIKVFPRRSYFLDQTVHNQKFAFVPASWKLVTVVDTISHTMNSPSTLSYLSLPQIQPNVYPFNYYLNTMLTCFLFSCFYLCNIYSEKLQTCGISLPWLVRAPKENHKSFADLCPHIFGVSSLIF